MREYIGWNVRAVALWATASNAEASEALEANAGCRTLAPLHDGGFVLVVTSPSSSLSTSTKVVGGIAARQSLLFVIVMASSETDSGAGDSGTCEMVMADDTQH